MWDDEAHVAIFSRNILKTGKITGWDGYNLFGFRNGTNLNQNLNSINPPFEYLITSLSYFLFSENTLTSRLPHVVLGYLSLIFFYCFVSSYFKNEKNLLKNYIFLSLSFSVIFILYIRQCRYYSLSIFLSLLTLYFYAIFLNKKTKKYLFCTVISAAALFYTHYLICAAFVITISLNYLFFYMKDLYHRRNLRNITTCSVLLLILIIPYSMYYQIWERKDLPSSLGYIQTHLILIYRNFRDINLFYFFPWIVFLVFIALLVIYQKKIEKELIRKIFMLLFIGIGNIFFISLLSCQPLIMSFPFADVRYLVVSIPIFSCIVGFTIYLIHTLINKYLAFIFLIIYLNCNILSCCISDYWQFRWLLPGYIIEIFSKAPLSDSVVSKFIFKYIPRKNTLYVIPEYQAYPLMFYLNNNYKFSCQINMNSHISKSFLDDSKYTFLFKELNFPQFIIMYSHIDKNAIKYFSRLNMTEKNKQYIYKLYAVISNIACNYPQKPELLFHSFLPKADGNIFIFRRENN